MTGRRVWRAQDSLNSPRCARAPGATRLPSKWLTAVKSERGRRGGMLMPRAFVRHPGGSAHVAMVSVQVAVLGASGVALDSTQSGVAGGRGDESCVFKRPITSIASGSFAMLRGGSSTAVMVTSSSLQTSWSVKPATGLKPV